VIDRARLIVTNQRVVGTARSVEVQLSPAVKIAATVVAADPARDVAVLRIDPTIAASLVPVPLGCSATKAPVVAGQEIFTIGVTSQGPKTVKSATVRGVDPRTLRSDLYLSPGTAGGPVFSASGVVLGLTSVVEDRDGGPDKDFPVIRVDEACAVVASAEQKMKDASPPSAVHLPMEPTQPFPVDALIDAAQHRAGSLNPYPMLSSDFDIVFITPVMTYAAQYQSEQASRRERARGTRTPDGDYVRPLMNFGNWSEYVAENPPVLLVRATPKLVEGFWTKVARGAAQTQGVSLPPMKRVKASFSRLRAFCGDAEVTPIHPFKLEQRVSETEAIDEGLYVFDPGALGPSCGTVKLVLYSEKEPEKGDSRTVDPKVIQQIWDDFAPYRAAAPRDLPPLGGFVDRR